MVLLCLSGSFIFWLPYFSDIYYVPVQRTFGFSNTQMGMLPSIFGFASLVSYAPGGWLADRYPARQLMSTALVVSGMGGFVFASIPTFEVCLVLYGLWGVSASLIFWSALIKAARSWGGQDEQGKAFGFLEGGRSLSDAAFGAIFLAIFAWYGADPAALSGNIQLTSSCLIFVAALVWVTMKDASVSRPDSRMAKSKFSWAKVQIVLRMPILWLLSLVILATNWGMWGTIYFTPYATEVYELGDVWGGAVGSGKYWLAAITAISAGFVADRIGTAKTVVVLFVLMISGFLLFAVAPGAPRLIPLLLINSVLIVTAVYALRGIYYALLEQGNIPLALTGTAVGMVSVIGYTPDVLAPIVSGLVLDAWPGSKGFQVLFLLIGTICIMGLCAAVLIYRKVQAGNTRAPS
jgi:nitrate/nitrite transporter NarK